MAPFFHLISVLQGNRHKASINSDLRSELAWWIAILQTSSNCMAIWDSARPITKIATDASSVAAGVFSGAECMYINWILDRPELHSKHINIKELAAVDIAVAKYAPISPNHHLVIYCDNSSVCYMLNKGYSRNHTAASMLKNIAVNALSNNCTLSAHYIPGKLNDIPDALSRLHQRGQIQRATSLLKTLHRINFPTCEMSHVSFLYLWRLWHREYNSWAWKNYVRALTTPHVINVPH